MSTSIGSIFKLPNMSDAAVSYLQNLFGMPINWILTPKMVSNSLPDQTHLLSSVLANFNSIVLTGAIAIFTYILIVGTLKTAEEGVFLGKEWSTMFHSLRSIGGIVCIMPFKFGFGLLQYLLLYVILLGVNLATDVWQMGVNSIHSGALPMVPSALEKEAAKKVAIGFLYASVNHILDGSATKQFAGSVNFSNSSSGSGGTIQPLWQDKTEHKLLDNLKTLPMHQGFGDSADVPTWLDKEQCGPGVNCVLPTIKDDLFQKGNEAYKSLVDAEDPNASEAILAGYWAKGQKDLCQMHPPAAGYSLPAQDTSKAIKNTYDTYCENKQGQPGYASMFAESLLANSNANALSSAGSHLPINDRNRPGSFWQWPNNLGGDLSQDMVPHYYTLPIGTQKPRKFAVDWEVGSFPNGWPGLGPQNNSDPGQDVKATGGNYSALVKGGFGYDFKIPVDGGQDIITAADLLEDGFQTMISTYVGGGCTQDSACDTGTIQQKLSTVQTCTSLSDCSFAPEAAQIMNNIIDHTPYKSTSDQETSQSLGMTCTPGTNPEDKAQSPSGDLLGFPFKLSQPMAGGNTLTSTPTHFCSISDGCLNQEVFDNWANTDPQKKLALKLVIPSSGTPMPLPVDDCRSGDGLCVEVPCSTTFPDKSGIKVGSGYTDPTKHSVMPGCFLSNAAGFAVTASYYEDKAKRYDNQAQIVHIPAMYCGLKNPNSNGGDTPFFSDIQPACDASQLFKGGSSNLAAGDTASPVCPTYGDSWWNGGKIYLSLNDQLAHNINDMAGKLSNVHFGPTASPTVSDKAGTTKTFNLGYAINFQNEQDSWMGWSNSHSVTVTLTIPKPDDGTPFYMIPWQSAMNNAKSDDVEYNMSVLAMFNPSAGTMQNVSNNSSTYYRCDQLLGADGQSLKSACNTECVKTCSTSAARSVASTLGYVSNLGDNPAPTGVCVLKDNHCYEQAGTGVTTKANVADISGYVLSPDPDAIRYQGGGLGSAATPLQSQKGQELFDELSKIQDPDIQRPIQLLISIQNEFLSGGTITEETTAGKSKVSVSGIMTKEQLQQYLLNMLAVLKVNGVIDSTPAPTIEDKMTSPVQKWMTKLFSKLLAGNAFSSAPTGIKFFSWGFQNSDGGTAKKVGDNVGNILGEMYNLGMPDGDAQSSLLDKQYNMIQAAQTVGVHMIKAVTDSLADISAHYKRMMAADMQVNGTVGGTGIASALAGSAVWGASVGPALATVTQISLQFMQFFETLAFAQSMMWMPLALGVLGAIFTAAITFTVVLPFTPFILFWSGQVAWLLGCVEVMAAAPLLAITWMFPGGHGAFGHAGPGLKIFLNVAMRPVLMVIGLFASMVMTYFLISMSADAFHMVANQIFSKVGVYTADGTNASSLTAGIIATIVIFSYATFILLAYTKCFSAIYVIPEKVAQYLGGGPADKAGQEELQQITQGVSSTSQTAVQSGSQTSTQGAEASKQGTSFHGGGGQDAQQASGVGQQMHEAGNKKGKTVKVTQLK